MVSNAKFAEYKEKFLSENKIPRGWVLLRRVRDNMLTYCKPEHKEHYEGHVVEPMPEPDEDVLTESETPAKKPGRKKSAFAASEIEAGEVDPNAVEA